MNAQYLPMPVIGNEAAGADGPFVFGEEQGDPEARALLLTEVDFKWLMAGQGWWINTDRFHFEPAYAADTLHSALASPCDALRACAANLQAQLGFI